MSIKKITEETKTEILEKVQNDGLSVKDLAGEYDVSTKSIYRWLKEGLGTSPSYWKVKKLEKENKALKELIGSITLEMEKSKKRG